MLTNCGYFWQLLAHFGNFWQLLATSGNFWQLLSYFDNFWQLFSLLVSFCRSVPPEFLRSFLGSLDFLVSQGSLLSSSSLVLVFFNQVCEFSSETNFTHFEVYSPTFYDILVQLSKCRLSKCPCCLNILVVQSVMSKCPYCPICSSNIFGSPNKRCPIGSGPIKAVGFEVACMCNSLDNIQTTNDNQNKR